MRWPTNRQWQYLIETVLVIVILRSVIVTLQFLLVEGRLPQPYFHGANDTFMDWINTAYWAHNPGAYYSFLSVYPPLSFDFLRIFSPAACYRFDNLFARECDWLFPWVFGAFFAVNAVLVFTSYWRHDRRTAWMRALAIIFGLPMLFAVERGQLVIPCFTFFVLAHGRILRSARLRWLSNAVAVNFKPYLVLTIIPFLVKRRWAAFEGTALAILGVYLVSYALEGVGTPLDILNNILNFSELATNVRFDNAFYQSSYKGILDALNSTFPFMYFIGSRPVEAMLLVFPLLIRMGQVGIVLCFVGAAWRPAAVPVYRLTAMSVAMAVTASLAGGYTQIFIFFLVFLEPWRGVARITAIVTAYLLSISGDYQLMAVARAMDVSYLTNRVVGYDVGVTLGEIVRPGLILLIEYALIAASLADIWRARHAVGRKEGDRAIPGGSLDLAGEAGL